MGWVSDYQFVLISEITVNGDWCYYKSANLDELNTVVMLAQLQSTGGHN